MMEVKLEPEPEVDEDFVETHCHWADCDRGDLVTQEQLVKVSSVSLLRF